LQITCVFAPLIELTFTAMDVVPQNSETTDSALAFCVVIEHLGSGAVAVIATSAVLHGTKPAVKVGKNN